jgi:hypothetical protein
MSDGPGLRTVEGADDLECLMTNRLVAHLRIMPRPAMCANEIGECSTAARTRLSHSVGGLSRLHKMRRR